MNNKNLICPQFILAFLSSIIFSGSLEAIPHLYYFKIQITTEHLNKKSLSKFLRKIVKICRESS